MWEVGLWADGVTVVGNELFYNYQVYNQAIGVPETIDAIRALTAIEEDGATSIQKTDAALGLVREFVPVSVLVNVNTLLYPQRSLLLRHQPILLILRKPLL